MQLMRFSSLVAAILMASAAAPDHIRAQDTPLPSRPAGIPFVVYRVPAAWNLSYS